MRCRRVYTWLLFLMLWGSIIFIISSHASGGSEEQRSTANAILIIVMILYYVDTFLYSYCSYFLNFASIAKSYEEMDKMFKAFPSITMNIRCYHYRSYRTRNGSIVTERVDTHKASRNFDYLSWRDISGKFELDTSEATKNEDVSYVLLDLSFTIEFAADGTLGDFEESKATFIRRNRLDDEYEYSEASSISYFQNCFLVQVTDQVPCLFGLGYFILFGILGFNALYSTYLDRFCKRQVFTIKKAISTCENLNAPEMESKYSYHDPRIIIINQVITFPQNQGPQVFALSDMPQQYVAVQQPPPQPLTVSMPAPVPVPIPVSQIPNPSQLPKDGVPNNQYPQTSQRQLQLDPEQPQPPPGQSPPVISYPPQPPPQESNAQLPSIVPNSQIDPENRV